ncbi:MAG: DUF3703 domain-containing protein [Saprospiraceae bacterium]
MKFNTSLPNTLTPFFNEELVSYQSALSNGNLSVAWRHLERAHILGQAYPIPHTHVHWKMLQFGVRIKSLKEVVGQIPRLLVGGIKSFVGKIPVGNPGGANVPALKPFPIEAELQNILEEAG